MIGLSQTTGYAIHALGCLDDPKCNPRLVRDIANCTGIPKPYLAKIVNQLAHKGLIVSKRGYRGGIFLARPVESITLLEVVEAIEGSKWIGDCLIGMDVTTNADLCPTHKPWQRIRHEIRSLLRKTTIADMIRCAQSIIQRGDACCETKVGGKKGRPVKGAKIAA